jgi:signal transduction histidine kinase
MPVSSDLFCPPPSFQPLETHLPGHQAEEIPHTSAAFARAIVDALPQHICILDETGAIALINRAWRSLAAANPLAPFNITEGANYLQWCQEVIGPAAPDAQAFAAGIRAVMRGQRAEFSLRYSSHTVAEQRWFVGRVTALPGDSSRFLIAHEDISERIWVEQALREAIDVAEAAQQEAENAGRKEEKRRQEADRRRQIAEGLRDILNFLNSNRPLDEVLNYIVAQARILLGSQAAAVYYAPPGSGEVVVQAARGLARGYLSSARHGSSQRPAKQTFLTPWPVSIPDTAAVDPSLDDPSLEVQDLILLAPPADEYRALLAVPILIKDEIYGRLRLYYRAPREFSEEDAELVVLFSEQVALAIENARLREQVKQAAISEERNRLARDLHDAVTQTIFSAKLMAEALPRVWERRPEDGLRGLAELHRLIQGALAEMRTLLLELRPTAIIEKKVGELLKQLTDSLASQAQLAITFTAEGDRTLPASVQIVFYRVAQEALNNIIKHAKASHVLVELRGQGEEMALRIRDDGRGFDPNAIGPDQFGVNIMRERAQSVGATCNLISQPGHGTEIVILWSSSAGRVKR